MISVVLDTHVALWWSLAPKRLSTRATRTIAQAESVIVPAIVFWEVSLLARKRKIELAMEVEDWSSTLLSISRVSALPLTPEVAIAADALEMHADPAEAVHCRMGHRPEGSAF
jgi:PIN domain nuclease of toxin-antitoxin system